MTRHRRLQKNMRSPQRAARRKRNRRGRRGRQLTANLVTAALCLLACAGALLGTHVIAVKVVADNPPPPACVADGGQWQILHGWTCYPPLPAPPAAHLEAGWA